jgi:hypothetical protein
VTRREGEAVAAKGEPSKVVLAAAAVVRVMVTALTWRDLRSRPAGEVRGPRNLWRVRSALNTSGSAAYWLFGRRRPALTGVLTPGGTPRQLALEPPGTKLLVVDKDSGPVRAYQIGRLP